MLTNDYIENKNFYKNLRNSTNLLGNTAKVWQSRLFIYKNRECFQLITFGLLSNTTHLSFVIGKPRWTAWYELVTAISAWFTETPGIIRR